MRKFMLGSLLMAVVFIASGCKKNDKDDVSGKPTFSVKINGSVWNPSTIAATYLSLIDETQVTALTGLTDELIIYFPGKITGTFDAGYEGCDFTYANGALNVYSTAPFFDNPVGHLEITRFDTINNVLDGTFFFEGYNDNNELKRFTEGSFSNIVLYKY